MCKRKKKNYVPHSQSKFRLADRKKMDDFMKIVLATGTPDNSLFLTEKCQ